MGVCAKFFMGKSLVTLHQYWCNVWLRTFSEVTINKITSVYYFHHSWGLSLWMFATRLLSQITIKHSRRVPFSWFRYAICTNGHCDHIIYHHIIMYISQALVQKHQRRGPKQTGKFSAMLQMFPPAVSSHECWVADCSRYEGRRRQMICHLVVGVRSLASGSR